MITALAQVVDLKAKKDGQVVYLSCDQQTTCKSCSSQDSCGSGLVSKALVKKSHSWQVFSDKDIKVGDQVEIGLSEKSLLESALLVYLFPLLCMIIATAFAVMFELSEGLQIISFIAGGLFGFIFAKKSARHPYFSSQYKVVLLRHLGTSVSNFKSI